MFLYIGIFVVLFLFYLHFMDQFKKGDQYEIYEIDYAGNTHLQEICQLKQPILFDFAPTISTFHYLNTLSLEDLSAKVGQQDVFVNVRDTNDTPSDDSIPLSFSSALALMDTDSTGHYISEGNKEFVQATVLEEYFDSFHEYIKPNYTCHTIYDVCFGSKGASTIMRHHTDSRKFIYVPMKGGRITVQMTPFKSSKYMHPIYDYEKYEFRSDYKGKDNKNENIQMLEYDVTGGMMLYIPPYWWYSIQIEEPGSYYGVITYCTAMNILANSISLVRYFYRQYEQSGQTKIVRTLALKKNDMQTETQTQEKETISLPKSID